MRLRNRIVVTKFGNFDGLFVKFQVTNHRLFPIIDTDGSDNLIKKLEERNIKAVSMHSNKEQSTRSEALKDFKAKNIRILVATDVAARGLDIKQLPCVINYDLPREANDYIHRVGRTGRAGQKGLVISLISHHEYPHFAVIEGYNALNLKREVIAGFEVDEVAPPLPRKSPKKKKPKLSKKQKEQLGTRN